MGQKFDKIYLRCNLQSDGTIPDQGNPASSPDIFSNGTEALANFRTVLATEESWKTQVPDKSVTGRDNYCYLRCRNNSDKAQSAKAQLFYVKASLILWPSVWIANAMKVDLQGNTVNNIPEMQPGEIGVAERPFIWTMPQSPGNDHYCLVGRIFNENYPNPIPNPGQPVDMATIIQTNLMYAKRNINIITVDTEGLGYYSVMLTAPATLQKPAKFHLFMYPSGAAGWDVETTCSMTDRDGRKIGMEKRHIENDDDIYMGQCVLEPGFAGVLSTYINTNGLDPTKGSVKIIAEYAGDQSDVNRLLSIYSGKCEGFRDPGLYNPAMMPLFSKQKLAAIAAGTDDPSTLNDTVGTMTFGSHTAYFMRG